MKRISSLGESAAGTRWRSGRIRERTSGIGALAAVAVLLACARPGAALPSRVHSILAYEAARMPGMPAEVADASCIGNPDDPIGDDLDNNLCEGAFDEDYDRVPRTILDLLDWSNPNLIWGQGCHFWNPAGGPDGGHLRLFNPPPRQNAYQRGAMLYRQAVAMYEADRGAAYYLLGRAAHLLTDLATPAHTHLDPHVVDRLAILVNMPQLGKDSFERYLGWHYVTRWDIAGDPDPTGRLRFERDLMTGPIDPIRPADLGDGGHPELGDLYKLFYSMAQQAARWDSNDRNGTGPHGIGGGSIRWPHEIDVAFSDPASITVWTVDRIGRRAAVTPVATVGQARILLPDLPLSDLRQVQVAHDGTTVSLHPRRIRRISQIADIDCRRMAQDLMPKAVAYTAALYRLFWQDTHPGDTTLAFAPLVEDVNGDGTVTVLDALRVMQGLGLAAADPGFDVRCDLDGNGRIDVADLLVLASRFGHSGW